MTAHKVLLAGLGVLLAAPPSSADTPREIAQQMVKTLAKAKDAGERADAAWNLGEKEFAEAAPALAQALGNDKAWQVRSNAAASLGKLGEAARPHLPALRAALEDRQASVVVNAATALQTLGVDPKELLPARKRVLADRDLTAAMIAAEALEGQVPATELLAVVLKALESEDIEVKLAAGRVLPRIGEGCRECIPELVQALDRHPAQIAGVLGRLKPPTPEVAVALTRLLKGRDAKTRALAATALGSMGKAATAAVPELVSAMLHDAEAEVRAKAALALGDMGTAAEAVIPDLIRALQQDKDAGVREAVCEGLGSMRLGAKEAIPALNAALQDPEVGVRNAAKRALFRVDPRR